MSDAMSIAVIFEGEPDRNMALNNWEGPIPRMGDHVELHGRDSRYIVSDVVWVLLPQLKEGKLERGLRITLKQDRWTQTKP